ncbi:MAG: AAA family ATPase [Beggiatoa sp. IS2]|nr:MAG: AAA family ATPase [Beggiatoa sp. IS2]
MNELQYLIDRIESLLTRVEKCLPTMPLPPNWQQVSAFRWRKQGHTGEFQPVYHPHQVRLRDLQGIDLQKQQIDRNTRQFLQRQPANNVLLWGARGTGKSSLIKALLNEYADQGLRLVEVEKHHLIDLPDIVDAFQNRPERFIIFCDDLSFEQDDASYKALKSVLDGSVSTPPENALIYATSNRRHLLPEYMRENLEAQHLEGEIHQGDVVEEKISLSERFGLWLSFYPFKQEDYLAIVFYWLKELGISSYDEKEVISSAIQWALKRGSRSGRAAWQFARDWAGQKNLR